MQTLLSFRFVTLAIGIGHFLCLFFGSTPLRAQERGRPSVEIIFRHLSIDDGLSNVDVQDMCQDGLGYLWVATADALNRYDGYTFRTYRHIKTDSFSVAGNTSRRVFRDAQGTLWTFSNSTLQRYDPAHDRFLTLCRLPIGSSTVNDICELGGYFWLTSFQGLFRISRQTGEYTLFQITGNPTLYSVVSDSSTGTVWCASSQYLYAFNTRTHAFKPFLIYPYPTEIRITSLAICENKKVLFSTSFTNGWIDTTRTGLVLYNPATQKIEQSWIQSEYNPITHHAPFVEQFVMQGDSVWAATDFGVYLISLRTGILHHFLHDPLKAKSLASSITTCLLIDRHQTLWVGHSTAGLSHYSPYRNKFGLYRHSPTDSNSLSNNYVRAILEDNHGNLWIATQYGGISKLDSSRQVWTRFQNNPKDSRTLSSNTGRALVEDKNGYILTGFLASPVLDCINPKTNEVSHISIFPETLISNSLTLLKDGRVIVSTMDGIAVLSKDKQQYHFDSLSTRRPDYALGIQGVFRTRREEFWVTSEHGLFRLDSSLNIIRRYRSNASDPSALSDDFTTHVCETERGELWIATKGGGVCRFIPETDRFERVTEADGLSHNNTYSILEDARGNLWISTDNGLCEMNPITRRIRTYTPSNGLQGNEFNRFAFHRSQRGEMFFGGTNGLNFFYPEKIVNNPYPPTVHLTGLKINDRDTTLDFLDTTSSHRSLQLPYNQNNIHFDFTAFDFTAPEQNQYESYLLGFDQSWKALGTKREVTYNNLLPGNYVLYAKSANSDGLWSDSVRVLSFEITAPFWMRWWFFGLAGFVIVGSGFGFYKVRLKSVQAQNHVLEKLIAERTAELYERNKKLADTLLKADIERQRAEEASHLKSELLGIASHDLKSPLQTVMGFSSLINEEQDIALIHRLSDDISTAARRMLRLIQELLDTSAAELGKIVLSREKQDVAILALVATSDNQARASRKNQRLILAEYDSVFALVDANRLRDVFDNLISNAIKYSPHGTEITVKLEKHRRNTVDALPDEALESLFVPESMFVVQFSVSDEGQGLSDADKTKLFGQFQRLSARPTSGESSTGLGLSIVKNIVELHGGKVWAESAGKGKGATFFVELPVAE
jgi:signal transduction histidine kinase/ligand-binding sensor domain-containing protein